MRASIGLAVLLLVASCEEPPEAGFEQIADCERDLLRDLRTPSTYKRVNAMVLDSPPMSRAVFEERTGSKAAPGETTLRVREVILEYDAENVFGAPLRDRKLCAFKVTEAEREAEARKPLASTPEIEAEVYDTGKRYDVDCCL